MEQLPIPTRPKRRPIPTPRKSPATIPPKTRPVVNTQWSSLAREVLFSLAPDMAPRALSSVVRRAVAATIERTPFGPLVDAPAPAMPFFVDAFLVSDAEMRDLNRETRGKDKATDVLSFPLLEGEPMPIPPDSPNLPLGDLVIAIETAHRQAQERGHAAAVEVAFLAIHGTLHLLGYDHANASGRRQMFNLQDEILEMLEKGEKRK